MNRYIPRFSVALLLFLVLPVQAQDVAKGRALFFKGKYAAAVEALRGRQPTPQSLIWLSRVLQEQGEYLKAINSILAYKNWREHAALVNRMGELEYAVARYAEARQHFERALELEPQLPEAQVNLGEMLARWGEKERARMLLNGVLSRYRETPQPDARLNVLTARACVPLNRFQDASNLLDDASRQAPEDWRILVRWGQLFLDKYNFAEARSTFQEALQRNPDADAALLGLAQA